MTQYKAPALIVIEPVWVLAEVSYMHDILASKFTSRL